MSSITSLIVSSFVRSTADGVRVYRRHGDRRHSDGVINTSESTLSHADHGFTLPKWMYPKLNGVLFRPPSVRFFIFWSRCRRREGEQLTGSCIVVFNWTARNESTSLAFRMFIAEKYHYILSPTLTSVSMDARRWGGGTSRPTGWVLTWNHRQPFGDSCWRLYDVSVTCFSIFSMKYKCRNFYFSCRYCSCKLRTNIVDATASRLSWVWAANKGDKQWLM